MCKVKLVKKIINRMTLHEVIFELHTELSIEPFPGLVLIINNDEHVVKKVKCPIGLYYTTHTHGRYPFHSHGHYNNGLTGMYWPEPEYKEITCELKDETTLEYDAIIEWHKKQGWKDNNDTHVLTVNDMPKIDW